MRKHIFIMINLIAIFYLSCANALQVQSAKDNQTLLFKISEKEFSRIFVNNDRIISIKGRNQFYEIKDFKSQSDEGVLYIRPILTFQKKPFSIFISTEKGHHFTLFLSSIDVPSENIEIKPVSAIKQVAKKWEKNLHYTQSIVVLMKDMVNGTQPEGYAVINMGQVKAKKIGNGLSMQLLTIYRGGFLQGEIWRLMNESRHTIYLHPREFYQDNIRAASIVDEALKTGDTTLFYRIVSHE